MAKGIIYQITVKSELDCKEDEQLRGLRWLLKRLLRQYGLRCVELRKEEEDGNG